MLGATSGGDLDDARPPRYLVEGDVVASVSYRYQFSHRHFVGDNEQEHRRHEGSEVKNEQHLWDVALTFAPTERLSLSVGLPILYAERSSPIRAPDRSVVDRSVTRASGIGDMTAAARLWLLDPFENPSRNIQLGLGLKAPTGEDAAKDMLKRRDLTYVRQHVDQSIQPGDGGWGFIVDLNAFQEVSLVTFYAQGAYLFNPRERNGTFTHRGRASEAVMSVPDAFVARLGAGVPIPWIPGLGFALGGRAEGIPPRDLLGESGGFRRPGIGVAVEPTVTFGMERHSVALSAPIAVYRNRWKSVTDEKDDTHGDAAFADWTLLVGYSIRF